MQANVRQSRQRLAITIIVLSIPLAILNISRGFSLRGRVDRIQSRLSKLEESGFPPPPTKKSSPTTTYVPRGTAATAAAVAPPIAVAAQEVIISPPANHPPPPSRAARRSGFRILGADMSCGGQLGGVCHVECNTVQCDASIVRCNAQPLCAAISFNCRASLTGCVGTLKTQSTQLQPEPRASSVVIVRANVQPAAPKPSVRTPPLGTRPVVTILAWDKLAGFVDWTQPAFVRDARLHCPTTECRFITNKADIDTVDGVLFHWPTRQGALPAKKAAQPWIMMYLEAGGNGRPWPREKMDLLSTFSLNSDIPLTYFSPTWSLKEFLKPPLSLKEKIGDLGGYGTSPALATAFISNCAKERTPYLLELMKHITVHNFGSCHGNAKEPDAEGRTANANKEWTTARYKFHLAFENDREGHYVTEKLFGALSSGSLPVYWGSPSVEDIVPFEHAFINAADYATPEALAQYMLKVSNDPVLYESYFEWKKESMVTEEVRAAFQAVVDMTAYKFTSMCRICRAVRARASAG